jgi:hypothetical protein
VVPGGKLNGECHHAHQTTSPAVTVKPKTRLVTNRIGASGLRL